MEATKPNYKPNIFSFIKRFFGHEITQMIIVAVAFVFGFVRPFVIEAYKIPSGSMEDTLLVGDRILVWKCMYGIKVPGIKKRLFAFHKPKRGDVFVFLPPHERDKNFIKRLVALEGDSVELEGKNLLVNGKKIKGNYTKYDRRGEDRYGFPAVFPPFGTAFGYATDVKPNFKNWSTFSEFNQETFDQAFQDYLLTRSEFDERFPQGKPFIVPRDYVFAIGDNRDNSLDSRVWGPVAQDDIKGQAFLIYFSMGRDALGKFQIRIGRTFKPIKSQFD